MYWCGDIDCEDIVGGCIGAGILTVRILSVGYWCGDIDYEYIVGRVLVRGY